jgi:hypothetical protein
MHAIWVLNEGIIISGVDTIDDHTIFITSYAWPWFFTKADHWVG